MALDVKTRLGHPPPREMLVHLDKIEKVTAGGIIIPDSDSRVYAQCAVSTGIVEELGRDVFEGDEPWLKVGDRVWYEKYQGQEYKIGDELYRTISPQSVHMFLPQEEF